MVNKTSSFNLKNFGLSSERLNTSEQHLVLPQNLILTKTTLRNLNKILYPLREGRNLLLIGDVGVGKNALIYYINQLRNLPTIRFNFNQDTMPEDLIGSFQILPDGFHWQDGPLITAMKNGYTFVADEMNLASPEILKRFLNMLKNKSLALSEKDATSCVAHKRFHFIATQNPSKGFEGRKILSTQILKYFTIIYIDSSPITEQIEIIRGLFPVVPVSLIAEVMELQNILEKKIWSAEIAKNSLEHLHFNIRSAQRFWKRILKDISNDIQTTIKIEQDDFMYNLFRFYVNCFSDSVDRKISLGVIKDVFLLSHEKLYDYYNTFLNQDVQKKISVLIKNLSIKPDQYELDPLPITTGRLKSLEEIYLSLGNYENLLLEGEEFVRMGELIDIVAFAHGHKINHIYLFKGMHTSDLLGSLRPIKKIGSNNQISNQVEWVDGPLTKAIKNQEWVVLENIEAAGSEIIEKLNMLLDDAAQLLLPPEAEPNIIIKKNKNTRIIIIKYFRKSRNSPTISRAFRNRFSNLIIPPVLDHELVQSALLFFYSIFQIDHEKDFITLMEKFVEFHKQMNIALINQKIDTSLVNIEPYYEENLLRWVKHLHFWKNEFESITSQTSIINNLFERLITQGAEIHYLSALPNEIDREWGRNLLKKIMEGLPLDELETKISTLKKKMLNSTNKKKMTWDPQKYFRKANTGKAKPKFGGGKLKKGIDINTPETGGSTKEGKNAWYGRDTLGNRGVGVPQGGGGAWGYRTHQIFDDFLKKYSPKWDYEMNFNLNDYYDHFGGLLKQIDLNLSNSLKTHLNTEREILSRGHRINMKKYLAYLVHQGSDRIFDNVRNLNQENQLKGMEVIFLINKGRRLFNFEVSMASVIALQSVIEVLNDHDVTFKIFGYSDFDNMKVEIDLIEYTNKGAFNWNENLSKIKKNEIFNQMISNWSGDTVEEYIVIKKIIRKFSLDARAKVIVMISDFRGHRAKQNIEDDISKRENLLLKETINEYSLKGYIFLGVQTGTRNIAKYFFDHFVWVNVDNVNQAPRILAEKLKDIILKQI